MLEKKMLMCKDEKHNLGTNSSSGHLTTVLNFHLSVHVLSNKASHAGPSASARSQASGSGVPVSFQLDLCERGPDLRIAVCCLQTQLCRKQDWVVRCLVLSPVTQHLFCDRLPFSSSVIRPLTRWKPVVLGGVDSATP